LRRRFCWPTHCRKRSIAAIRLGSDRCWRAILKGDQSGEPALLPGKSNASKLIRMVTDQVEDLEMPPLAKRAKYPALSKDEVALLKSWIDEGVP
jgi:hypothetical protein